MTPARYSTGAIILHWAIAIAVIVNWRIAEAAHGLPDTERGEVMGWHFALGMTILLLTVARIVWRLMRRPPPMQASLKGWEVALAKVIHALFYILLIALPMLGWIAMSGYDYAIDVWGISWPVLPVGFGEETAGEILDVHETLGKAMLVLIALHILGALKHTFIDRNGNLYRMLPFGRPTE